MWDGWTLNAHVVRISVIMRRPGGTWLRSLTAPSQVPHRPHRALTAPSQRPHSALTETTQRRHRDDTAPSQRRHRDDTETAWASRRDRTGVRPPSSTESPNSHPNVSILGGQGPHRDTPPNSTVGRGRLKMVSVESLPT